APNMKKFVVSAFSAAAVLVISAAAFAQNSLPQPKQEKLLNGLKVLMWPMPKAESVTVTVRVHSGTSFDPQGKEGVMRLLAENIFPEQAARDFFAEDLGGGLSIEANYDYIEITASSKPENFLSMLETLSAAIANPTIDKPTTAKLMVAVIEELKKLESDPSYVADNAVAARLFGTFPYGRPKFGTSATVAKIDFADLLDAKQRFLTADNATVAVTGNFDRVLGFRAIRRYFGAWLKSDRRVPSTFRQPDPPAAAVLSIPSPKSDAHAVRFALRGAARGDKTFAASRVYALILNARLKARVPSEHSGDVFVRSESHILPGIITLGFDGNRNESPNVNGKVEANELVAKILADPVTEAEFQSARKLFRDEWMKRSVTELFLDNDTFKTASPDADATAADTVTFDDVRNFAVASAKQPVAAILLNTPATAN
ncbi:MAG: insulinase family protein, partial [Pyrinomonadaceae bacterium]|nr:insulinase family protein [Pyrinomonadaceae bacterium]